MTTFIIVCAAMIAAALLWIVLPLLRAKSAGADSRKERRISAIAIALVVPALAAGMYQALSKWNWKEATAQAARQEQMDELLEQLEAKLAANPDDVNGWLLLGRSYRSMGRFEPAVEAFQNAYDRSRGENVEAIVSLGEALVMVDEATLTGRAGRLFEAALAREPNNPKALWYGGIAAIQAGDLRRGRDRLQLLLALNPPEEARSVLERQIQDLNQQLGEAGPRAPAGGTEGALPAAAHRSIKVAVSIAPQIREQLKGASVPLFILARDPSAGGPPLAVQRHSSSDLPITVELSERDAMIAARTIATVPRVQVVARLSRSGTPQARSGDYYGEAEYDFSKNAAAGAGTLNIIIDRAVP